MTATSQLECSLLGFRLHVVVRTYTEKVLASKSCCTGMVEGLKKRMKERRKEGEAENEDEEHAALMDCEMEEGGDVEEILALIDGDAETEDEGSQVFYGPEVPPEMAVHDAAPRSVDSNSSGSVAIVCDGGL